MKVRFQGRVGPEIFDHSFQIKKRGLPVRLISWKHFRPDALASTRDEIISNKGLLVSKIKIQGSLG
jgi:hypothetical protein